MRMRRLGMRLWCLGNCDGKGGGCCGGEEGVIAAVRFARSEEMYDVLSLTVLLTFCLTDQLDPCPFHGLCHDELLHQIGTQFRSHIHSPYEISSIPLAEQTASDSETDRLNEHNEGPLLPSRHHNKLPHPRHPSTCHIHNPRSRLRHIPIRRPSRRQLLHRRPTDIPLHIQEQHPMVHVQTVRHKPAMIKHNPTLLIPRRRSK